MNLPDELYCSLLRKILQEGEKIEQRAVLKDGTFPYVKSLIGHQLRFDLEKEFPLLISKKVHWKSIVHELLWFFKGETNINYLKDNNIRIWDEWAKDNDLGKYVYPYMWNHYPSIDGEVNQLDLIQEQILKVKSNPNDPCARRIILTAWHPVLHPEKAPPACHTMVQFFVRKGTLSCHMYQRSADYILG